MAEKKQPQRMCVGCRSMTDKRKLIRIVRGTDGTVSVDLTGRKNGRGAYLCPKTECLKRAIKQRQLERQLEVSLTPELVQSLETAVHQAEQELPHGE